MRLTDNSPFHPEQIYECKSLVDQLLGKTLNQLEKDGLFVFPPTVADADDLDRDNTVFRWQGDSIWTTNIMGFIGNDSEQLIIGSRFSNDSHKYLAESADSEASDFFLEYMLEKVLGIPNVVDLFTQMSSQHSILDMLPLIFPYYLREALQAGLYKEYVRREYNDANVRGVIDIARFIKKDVPFTGKIAYNQREFSYDNDVMELIRHTIEYLGAKQYGQQLLSSVRDEVRMVVEATQRYDVSNRQKIVDANLKHPVRHQFYSKYRKLQQLCLMILHHRKVRIGQGRSRIQGILFDGAWLWEEYMNTLISEKFYHPRNKQSEGAHHLFDGYIGKIYPDFIGRDAEQRIVADAKYKPVRNIRGQDYFQVLAYMMRFDSKHGYYLYPLSKAEKAAEGSETQYLGLDLHLMTGTRYEGKEVKRNDDDGICVTKLGLEIPQAASSYEEFKEQIAESEEKFLNELL